MGNSLLPANTESIRVSSLLVSAHALPHMELLCLLIEFEMSLHAYIRRFVE